MPSEYSSLFLRSSRLSKALLYLLALSFFYCYFRFSFEISSGIQKAIVFVSSTLIPKLFPLFILCDFFLSFADPRDFSLLSSAFSRVFRISPAAFLTIVGGLLFGFPFGITAAVSDFRLGVLTKEETERAVILSTIPSAGFLIGGIGYMFHSLRLGVFLYALCLFSSLTVGLLMGIGKSYSKQETQNHPPRFSLVKSIRCATEKTIGLSGFVLFFCGVASLVLKLPAPFSYFLISVLEISSCALFFSSFPITPFCVVCLAFCACFCGISFLFQSFFFICDCPLSKTRIVFFKIVIGTLGGILSALLYPFFF